jgi:hypothetical protein
MNNKIKKMIAEYIQSSKIIVYIKREKNDYSGSKFIPKR